MSHPSPENAPTDSHSLTSDDAAAPTPADTPATNAPSAAFTPVLRRKGRFGLPSLVWLVPIVAALIGLSLLVQSILARGPQITVSFLSADGLSPGKTAVRYKDVDIGLVESVHLASDRSRILATIALNPDARAFTAQDTRFWVVRPRLALSGVSGLGTLLSGAYIGVDAGKSAQAAQNFVGLEVPPIVTADDSGKQFVLQSRDLGSLNIGSPVFYRRVQVGQVVAYQLDPDGQSVTLRIFIAKPYDRLVQADTRFWHASGIDLKLDAGGFKLSTQSLMTVILGGIAFQTPDYAQNLQAAPENSNFALDDNEAQALKKSDGIPVVAIMNFDQSVRGLSPGAPVDFRGVEVGSVRSIGIEYQATSKRFRLPVVVELFPDRLGLKSADLRASATAPNAQHASHASHTPTAASRAASVVSALMQRGIRAQLRTGNLLTGQLYVALDAFPKAPPITTHAPSALPELATVPGALDALQAQVANIVKRLDNVPIDSIAQDLRQTLSEVQTLLRNSDGLVRDVRGNVAPEVERTLSDARLTLQSAHKLLSQDAPLQQDARRTLQELARTAQSLRTLSDYLERHPESLLKGKAADPVLEPAQP